MPEDGPQADTTQSPSPLVAMLWTLMPGPGDHFDFVLMHANSEVPANDLFTTQSEADPLVCRRARNTPSPAARGRRRGHAGR